MPAPVPLPVRLFLASREMRLHHYLWHGARNGWLTTFSERAKTRFREIGWEPPRPAVRLGPDGRRQPILDHDSGEDFLFMHRQMIAALNDRLAEVADPAYPRIEGWARVPAPDDREYPVPPAFEVPDNPGLTEAVRSRKTGDFYHDTMVPRERRFTDPDQLRSVTLGRLGAELEFTIHNAMHMRWCTAVTRLRPDPAESEDPRAIPFEWDDLANDWLGDTYSSHVNDVFWKLHGWVDARIDGWAEANQVEEIEWTGTWEGPHGHAPHPDDPPHHARLTESAAESRERVAEIEDVLRAVGGDIPAGFRMIAEL